MATLTHHYQQKTDFIGPTECSEKSATTTITSHEPESVSVKKPAAMKPCALSAIPGFFKQK